MEALVGHTIGDIELYREAFVHKSMQDTVGLSFERLELLGDAVLGLLVTESLMERFPHASEGELSRMRDALVSGKQLARYARALNLGRWIVASSDERRRNIGQNQRILACVLEAVLGALHLDLGLGPCRAFVRSLLEQHTDLEALAGARNYKDELLWHAQLNGLGAVTYELQQLGPHHKPTFTSQVRVGGSVRGHGTARSKKASEMLAAQHAVSALKLDRSATPWCCGEQRATDSEQGS